MAKVSSIEKNERRKRTVKRCDSARKLLKKVIMDKKKSSEDRFAAVLKLASMSRDGSATRVRLRCSVTGRPRGNYQRFGLSRIALRDLAAFGQIPGMVKSSW